MLNFSFYSPTKFVFGKGEENNIGQLLSQRGTKKVLLHYGGQSAEKSGLLGRVRTSLKGAGIEFVELGGVHPNPRYSLAVEGMELARKENVDLILAVGGGSVVDSAKCIAAGTLYDGDVWQDLYIEKKPYTKVLPVACILTIAAAGSEGSAGSVISNREVGIKEGIRTNDLLRPVLSILNPELTMSLPAYQTACGVTDMFVHITERYFTNTRDVDITDELAEALMRTILKYGIVCVKEPDNYNARAQIMWAGMLAHNNICGVDREQDWASHHIQRRIGAKYDSAHGAGLATIFPAWAQYVYKHDVPRFVRFATKVMGVDNDVFHPEEVALEGIRRIKAYFASLGMPTSLSELGVKDEDIKELANFNDGFFVKLTPADMEKIFDLAK